MTAKTKHCIRRIGHFFYYLKELIPRAETNFSKIQWISVVFRVDTFISRRAYLKKCSRGMGVGELICNNNNLDGLVSSITFSDRWRYGVINLTSVKECRAIDLVDTTRRILETSVEVTLEKVCLFDEMPSGIYWVGRARLMFDIAFQIVSHVSSSKSWARLDHSQKDSFGTIFFACPRWLYDTSVVVEYVSSN